MGQLELTFKKLEELYKIADVRPVEWSDGKIKWINVKMLPWKEEFVESNSIERLAKAIKDLEIRGAPAIGVAAALGLAMVAYNSKASTTKEIFKELKEASQILSKTRPTAYNLFWALERIVRKAEDNLSINDTQEFKEIVLNEALKIQIEDIEANIKMEEIGEKIIKDNETILTHCNTGALATAGYGTALGVIRTAWRKGKKINVIATETRPLLQGARLTAWELKKEGIPYKLTIDSAVGYLMMKGYINRVILGADRILTNGYVANKIGTYTIAVLAKRHGIPFHVVAPTTTIDPKSSLEDFRIELRSEEEVTTIMGKLRIAPEGTSAINPAFDITPPELITSIITEKGIATPPYEKSILDLIL